MVRLGKNPSIRTFNVQYIPFMRFILAIFLSLSLGAGLVSAQLKKHVRWAGNFTYTSEQAGTLSITAFVDQGWHLYSMENPPNPTVFDVSFDNGYRLSGKMKEPKPVKENDEYLGPVAFFKEAKVVFTGQVTFSNGKAGKATVLVEGQVCTDDNGECLPFSEKIEIQIPAPEGKTVPASDTGSSLPVPSSGDSDGDGVPDETDVCPGTPGRAEWQGCPDSDGDGVADHVDACPSLAANTADGCPEEAGGLTKFVPERMSDSTKARLSGAGSCVPEESSRTPWGILIAGMIGGLLALLTPCVFPMIPLTVTFFTKQSKNRAIGLRNALIYAFSIVGIYTGLGLLITLVFGAEALNSMATSAFWNLLFFAIFVVFAISFLGAFEIVLPSWLVNSVDKGANRGGLIGIFFMAFTLSLVSFSCTGPIIGSLLVEAGTKGDVSGPFLGMLGFSLALALPFALFAAFPGWLNSLPRSGSWLSSVKVTLGMLELALALKFLSTVDMAYHWDFLYRDRFIAIWIAIFGALALYLFGLIRTSSDGPERPALGVPRILMGLLVLSFTIYLIPGLSGHPLRLLAGIAPPANYMETSSEVNHCPQGLPCVNDFDEAMTLAKASQKPIFIDFTGFGCTNCRQMEENVWIMPETMERLKNDFIVASLYVDDKKPLEEGHTWISPLTNLPVQTIGQRWSAFQQYYFGSNSQPLYVVVDVNGKVVGLPYGYNPNQQAFYDYLTCSLARFKEGA